MNYLVLGCLLMGVSLLQAQEIIATAPVSATSDQSSVSGLVTFTQLDQAVKVSALIKGLTPNSKHGFHVHENGSCDDMAKAAGGHFNPHGVTHGFLPNQGHEHAHLGDMGNLEANQEGVAQLEVIMPGLNLSTDSASGILNRAIIVHEKEDDFGQPLGNAGGRIGCGIIAITNE